MIVHSDRLILWAVLVGACDVLDVSNFTVIALLIMFAMWVAAVFSEIGRDLKRYLESKKDNPD